MFSAVEMTITVSRVCGHSETQDIRYKGTREKQQIQHYERLRFCKACQQQIRDWFSDSSAAPYPLSLRPLSGSEKQVAWADRLRAGRAFQLLKVMALAASDGSKTGIALWQAIHTFIQQCQARFWIDNKDEVYGPDYFALEASYYLMPSTIGVQFSPRSIFGMLKEKAPYRIQEAKAILPHPKNEVVSETQAIS